MHSSNPSSSESWGCHIDWRPSRWLCLALVALGLMAGASVLLTPLPPLAKAAGALLAAVHGVRLARREWGRAPLSLDWPGGDQPAWLTGREGVQRLDGVALRRRGPLATLSGTDASGRRRHLAWWPDTLAPASRRQLTLAAPLSGRSANPFRKQAA